MKKIITLFGLLLIFGLSYGKQVDENIAKIVGKSFLASSSNVTTSKIAINLQLVFTARSKMINSLTLKEPATMYYVFNVSPAGFVIVAGDDNITPILGYSDHGVFDPDNIPQNVAKWFEGYKQEIRYILENKIIATDDISGQWQNLKNGNPINSVAKSIALVNPLMQTQWNQSPYYNALCPGGSVTGCVATAMAQIMKYWNYPATGSGFHSYNHQTFGTLSANLGSTSYQWSSMPNSIS